MSTLYVVLSRDESGHWREAGPHVAASSAYTAIRRHVDGTGKGGIFVAVPARSFRALEVALEQRTRVVIRGSEPGAAIPGERSPDTPGSEKGEK